MGIVMFLFVRIVWGSKRRGIIFNKILSLVIVFRKGFSFIDFFYLFFIV